jgi:hypothetical protein
LESDAGCNRVVMDDPKTLQERTQTLLRKQGLLSRWREEIDDIFQKLQLPLEAQLYSGDPEHRLIVIIYGRGIAIERDKLWRKFREIGIQIPLDLRNDQESDSFLRALFTGNRNETQNGSPPQPFFTKLPNAAPLDVWIVEADDALHALCESKIEKGQRIDYATGMSFDRLRSYREELSKTLYNKVLSGVSGPLELAAYAKSIQVAPRDGVRFYADDVVMAFIRETFLGGNGTLVLSNSFVEWASVQAIKRAQPRMLVARFGVRDKMKPFSSLLLFSKPRSTDQIPILQDPLGSFIDVEILSYYIWLSAEKGPPYRQKTLYLLLAEGMDEILAILPGSREPTRKELQKITLSDVAVTMAHWLGSSLPASPGRVIDALVG